MAQRSATPQAGRPARTGVPGQTATPAPIERTVEPGTPAGAVGPGPGGEAGDARAAQVAQSTAAGSARVPEIPDDLTESNKPQRSATSTVPRERPAKDRGETMVRPAVPPVGPAVLVRDLRKTPRLVGEAGKGMKDAPIEARTEDEALDMANAKGRAVLTVGGWVCPSIVKERVA